MVSDRRATRYLSSACRAVVCSGNSRLFWNLVSRMTSPSAVTSSSCRANASAIRMPVAASRPKSVRVHHRSDRACRLECRRGAKQPCDLVRSIDVRRAPLDDGVAECICRRNLMARILGVHRQREPSHGEQPIAALLRRWRTCGPCKDTSTLDVPVATLLGEGDVAPQQDVLDTELEPQRVLLVHVSCKISAQHHASPGQGCAICCSIVTSTLA